MPRRDRLPRGTETSSSLRRAASSTSTHATVVPSRAAPLGSPTSTRPLATAALLCADRVSQPSPLAPMTRPGPSEAPEFRAIRVARSGHARCPRDAECVSVVGQRPACRSGNLEEPRGAVRTVACRRSRPLKILAVEAPRGETARICVPRSTRCGAGSMSASTAIVSPPGAGGWSRSGFIGTLSVKCPRRGGRDAVVPSRRCRNPA
jgi:hypothetical protein